MSQKEYDFLIVGAGLFGSVFAYEATKRGKKCLVIDGRNHIGGNCYTENVDGINVHKYGAHIFRTDDKKVWEYVNQFAEFNRFTNCPLAKYIGQLYNLPFNMNTFHQLWGVTTPRDAEMMIKAQRVPNDNPKNLEEKVLDMVGTDIYEKFIKHYTEKQWGKKCSELDVSVISRIPVRMTFDNNYFNDRFQGVPIGGYTQIFEKLLRGSKVALNASFFEYREELESLADKIVFTGKPDEFFDYKFGRLPYRSLKFVHAIFNCENYQGNAVVNYTDKYVEYTRTIEHKHFEGTVSPKTIVTEEYPMEYEEGCIPFYPVKNAESDEMYAKYKNEATKSGVIFGGSIAEYKDYTMAEVIGSALETVKKEFGDTDE